MIRKIFNHLILPNLCPDKISRPIPLPCGKETCSIDVCCPGKCSIIWDRKGVSSSKNRNLIRQLSQDSRSLFFVFICFLIQNLPQKFRGDSRKSEGFRTIDSEKLTVQIFEIHLLCSHLKIFQPHRIGEYAETPLIVPIRNAHLLILDGFQIFFLPFFSLVGREKEQVGDEDRDGGKRIWVEIEGYQGRSWGVVDFVYREQWKVLSKLIRREIDYIPSLMKFFQISICANISLANQSREFCFAHVVVNIIQSHSFLFFPSNSSEVDLFSFNILFLQSNVK